MSAQFPSFSSRIDNYLPPVETVKHILLAEFDQLKGSTVKKVYPEDVPLPVEKESLADLMLPEGAHLREFDWTIFFLKNKVMDAFTTSILKIQEKVLLHRFDDKAQKWGDPKTKDSYLTFEFNKKTHKWNLCVAEDGEVTIREVPNDTLQFTVLAKDELFCSLWPSHGNCVGLRFLSDPGMHKVLDTAKILQSADPPAETEQLLVCLNLVQTRKDEKLRRGAEVKAICLTTPYRYLDEFKKMLMLALSDIWLGTDENEVMKKLYQSFNGQSVRVPKSRQRTSLFSESIEKGVEKDNSTTTIKLQYGAQKMKFEVKTVLRESEVTGVSISSLIRKFGAQMPVLYNAILLQKRVLFLGYEQRSSDVCNYVLASCLLVSPPFSKILHRCYPYACLTNMDFLQVEGYIAGVTNPVFKDRGEWWDICCDISNGEIIISEKYKAELDSVDCKYQMDAVDAEFQEKLINGIDMRYPESWVRTEYMDFTEHLVYMSLRCEAYETPQEKEKQRIAQKWRLSQMERTKAYEELAIRDINEKKCSPNMSSIRENVRQLQITTNLITRDTERIFNELQKKLQSEMDVEILLGYLRPSLGGIFPIISHLAHESINVRRSCLHILREIESVPRGEDLLKEMNYFMMLLFIRAKREFGESDGFY